MLRIIRYIQVHFNQGNKYFDQELCHHFQKDLPSSPAKLVIRFIHNPVTKIKELAEHYNIALHL